MNWCVSIIYRLLEKEAVTHYKYCQQSQKIKVISDMNDARSKHSGASGLFETPTQFGSDMLELLTARRGMGASDPRDMVFAHVGIAIDSQDEGLTVDYSKSCEEVYEDCARWLARRYGNQALLDNACHDRVSPGPHQLRLPSWAPDWTRPVIKMNYGSCPRSENSAVLAPAALANKLCSIRVKIMGYCLCDELGALEIDDPYRHTNKAQWFNVICSAS